MYVYECEFIYDEVPSESNLSKELGGQRHTYELAFYYEFTTSKTQSIELNVQSIIGPVHHDNDHADSLSCCLDGWDHG